MKLVLRESYFKQGNPTKVKDKNPLIGRYEDTLLHAVAERGHLSIFKLILNEVVNKNPKGHFADTPLHFAAEKGHTGNTYAI